MREERARGVQQPEDVRVELRERFARRVFLDGAALEVPGVVDKVVDAAAGGVVRQCYLFI